MTEADIFDKFTIRYEVSEVDGIKVMLEAAVWETHHASPDETPLLILSTKWDGCSHLRMPSLHFDLIEDFQALVRCVEFIYGDLCDECGVGEPERRH